MARLRKFVCYRRLERPYTRISKYRELSYIKGSPHILITKFDMGNVKGDFEYKVSLVALDDLQIRQNAIEAARKLINKYLDLEVGYKNYHFQIRAYPFHILRENPLATGAGADRLSTGMKHAFGKPIGRASQVRRGKVIYVIYTNKEFLDRVIEIAELGKYKLPGHYRVVVEKLNESN